MLRSFSSSAQAYSFESQDDLDGFKEANESMLGEELPYVTLNWSNSSEAYCSPKTIGLLQKCDLPVYVFSRFIIKCVQYKVDKSGNLLGGQIGNVNILITHGSSPEKDVEAYEKLPFVEVDNLRYLKKISKQSVVNKKRKLTQAIVNADSKIAYLKARLRKALEHKAETVASKESVSYPEISEFKLDVPAKVILFKNTIHVRVNNFTYRHLANNGTVQASRIKELSIVYNFSNSGIDVITDKAEKRYFSFTYSIDIFDNSILNALIVKMLQVSADGLFDSPFKVSNEQIGDYQYSYITYKRTRPSVFQRRFYF
jgi:hypothetical protein